MSRLASLRDMLSRRVQKSSRESPWRVRGTSPLIRSSRSKSLDFVNLTRFLLVFRLGRKGVSDALKAWQQLCVRGRRCMLHAMPSSNGVRNAVRIALWSCLLALSPLTSFAAPSITLAWDPSPDPSVVGYKVYWGVATRNYTNSLSAGSATTLTVSNLVIGTPYYFAATAYDTNGIESDYSVEASGSIALPNQPPTLNAISPVAINEGAGTQTVNLSGITSGATNENQ